MQSKTWQNTRSYVARQTPAGACVVHCNEEGNSSHNLICIGTLACKTFIQTCTCERHYSFKHIYFNIVLTTTVNTMVRGNWSEPGMKPTAICTLLVENRGLQERKLDLNSQHLPWRKASKVILLQCLVNHVGKASYVLFTGINNYKSFMFNSREFTQ